jgi:hypothetical protein
MGEIQAAMYTWSLSQFIARKIVAQGYILLAVSVMKVRPATNNSRGAAPSHTCKCEVETSVSTISSSVLPILILKQLIPGAATISISSIVASRVVRPPAQIAGADNPRPAAHPSCRNFVVLDAPANGSQ